MISFSWRAKLGYADLVLGVALACRWERRAWEEPNMNSVASRDGRAMAPFEASRLDLLMEQVAALIGQGLVPPALPLLDDMVARAPEWAEAWNKRATALYLAGEHDRSLADIDRVLALEPRHFGALAGMGLIRIAKGQFREALAAYRRALAVNPFLTERFELIPALERMVGEKPI